MADINLYLKNFKKDGSNIWFEKIYTLFLPRIYRYFYLRLFVHQQAEDLTSEVFIRVYKNLRKTSLNDKTFSIWIYRIASNLLIDHFRKNEQHSKDEPLEEMDNKLAGSDMFIKNSPLLKKELGFENIKLIEAIEKLTKLQKDVVILKFVEDFDYVTISKILGRKQLSVRGIAFRALTKLKEEIRYKT
jgi:RNA polymerase sigma-70 factor, ECF subfamily